ncbi:FAD-binding domain-containing protein [Sulfitobacter guttiformis]|uniref:Deoxyribodipyrimidine photo-lyase n=1 Tax=Sulfitobacter guttiformis TaxID=74349 RepID=A0A420DIX4_9RHOB|nr:FAD-binding domain-containing protein [Sulfitobacter guttiformis]RKE94172.1 deoxyribodipyrimidine photo-lyase [Sulfitobacter guttiformis]
MNKHISPFPPSAAAAYARLAEFAPYAGQDYAKKRNFDLGGAVSGGPSAHSHVSTLSPYLRMKLLDEGDVSRAVLNQMTPGAADKFIAEVWWRTYWKGWMEQRPTVWTAYRDDLARLHNEVQTQSGLRQRWEAACLGETGIDPFDHWARELAQTGYLHNHARMWFASIWIFTLKLPWQLGADFFLRHLLDGDAAVNTLSWRWVAGIQTQGKTYLAEASNIAKFTDGRFIGVKGLADSAVPVTAPAQPNRQEIAQIAPYDGAPADRVGLLLHSDDIVAPPLDALGVTPVSTAYLDCTTAQSPWRTASMVTDFRKALVHDLTTQAMMLDADVSVSDWASAQGLDRIITPHAPVGAVRSALRHVRKAGTVPVTEIRRPIDSAAWPLATAGFFKFRAHIPELLEQFG